MEAPSSQGRRFSVLKAIETGKVPSPVVPDGFNAKMSERSSHFDFSNEADRQAAKQSTDSNRSEDEGSTSPKAGRMSYRHSSASDDDEPPAARRSYRVRAESIDDPMLMISSDPAAQALAAHLAIPEAVEEEEDDDTPEGGEEKRKEVDGPAPSQTGAPGGAKQQETATRESDTESDTAPSEAPVPLWREQQAAAEQAGSKDGSHRETRRRAASEAFSNHHLAISGELHESFNRPKLHQEDDRFIGSFTCRGMENGQPKPNQDYACFCVPFGGMPGSGLFLVCDGHGKQGDNVSQEVLNSLIYELEEGAESLAVEPAHTICDAFEAVNLHLRALAEADPPEIDTMQSGACAVLAYVKESSIYVAGVGDCQAFLGTRHEHGIVPHPLSMQHAVDSPSEKVRLEAAGGHIRPAYVDTDGETVAAKLYRDLKNPRKGPGLAVARSLGDLDGADIGVIAIPEITRHKVDTEDAYLILATDGVWEFLGPDQVLELVDKCYRSGKSAEEASKFVIALAANQWRVHETDYRDDITVVIAYLQPLVDRMISEVRLS